MKSDEYRADWETYLTDTSHSPNVTLGDHFRHQQ
jgi:hypothetical protein